MKYWLYAFVMNLLGVLPGKGWALSLRGTWASMFLAHAGRNLKLSCNVQIYDPAKLRCGDNVYIGLGTYIGGGDVELDNEVIIGPYCAIVAGDHTLRDGSYRFGAYDYGRIRIGAGTWLGAHATITNNVTIGRGCLVAANSVVTSDVPDGTVVAGVPARPVKHVDLDPPSPHVA